MRELGAPSDFVDETGLARSRIARDLNDTTVATPRPLHDAFEYGQFALPTDEW